MWYNVDVQQRVGRSSQCLQHQVQLQKHTSQHLQSKAIRGQRCRTNRMFKPNKELRKCQLVKRMPGRVLLTITSISFLERIKATVTTATLFLTRYFHTRTGDALRPIIDNNKAFYEPRKAAGSDFWCSCYLALWLQ